MPNPATPDVYRHLGIILDNTLVNAPDIRFDDFRQRQISGGSDDRSGSRAERASSQRGQLAGRAQQDTDQPGSHQPDARRPDRRTRQASRSSRSLIAVVLFMIVYYRFAGVVACIALTFNLLMVLALMVLIKAAFTLPGLAGSGAHGRYVGRHERADLRADSRRARKRRRAANGHSQWLRAAR